jgi:hypothetical protein
LCSATNGDDTFQILEVTVVSTSSGQGGFHQFREGSIEAVLIEELVELSARQAKVVLLFIRCDLQELISIGDVTAAKATLQTFCSVQQR